MIIVECANDELLLRTLKVPRKRIEHKGGGREEVVKAVLEMEAGSCIGMIDADPSTAHGRNRGLFKDRPMKHGVRDSLYGRRRLVVIQPRLEGWLLSAVEAAGLRMSVLDKGLSDDERELHGQLAPRGDKRMAKIIGLLEKKGSAHLKELRRQLGI